MDALNDQMLLSDEQVREFIVNGFVRFDAGRALGAARRNRRRAAPDDGRRTTLRRRVSRAHSKHIGNAGNSSPFLVRSPVLGAISAGLGPALAKIEQLLQQTNPAWREAQVAQGWTTEDQVRMNAAAALLNATHAGEDPDAIERIATAALGDRNGYVSAIASEVLASVAR